MGVRDDRSHIKQFCRSLFNPEDTPGIMVYEVVGTGEWKFIKLYEEL